MKFVTCGQSNCEPIVLIRGRSRWVGANQKTCAGRGKKTRSMLSDSFSINEPFELLMLAALPCGCVTADYRASSMDVDLISLEVKGPHCTMAEHHAGHVLSIDESRDALSLLNPR